MQAESGQDAKKSATSIDEDVGALSPEFSLPSEGALERSMHAEMAHANEMPQVQQHPVDVSLHALLLRQTNLWSLV